MRGIPGARRVAAVVGLLAASACEREPKKAPPATIPPVVGSTSEVADLPLSPVERRQALAALYRPAPDRRLIRSLDEIERVVTGKPPTAPAKARYEGATWVVTAGDRELAKLSEIPTFEEALAAATARAQELAKAWRLGGPVAHETNALPFDDEVFAALTGAQEAWAKGPTHAALHEAAGALTAMTFTSSNGMDLPDHLAARALAVVALDKALGAPTLPLETTLALAFGYRTAAEKLAESLPKRDPVRQYLLDEPALAAAARAPDAPAWTRYLWVRRLTAKGDRTALTSFRESAFPNGDIRLPLLALRSGYAEFAEAREVASLYPAVALLEAGTAARVEDAVGATKSLRSKPLRDAQATEQTIRKALATARGATLARFDRDLPKVGASDSGPFLDAELHRSHLRAFMYSAELAAFLFELDSYGSAPAAKELLDALEASPSTEAQEFKAWGLTMVAIAQGADPVPAIARIGATSPFGFAPRSRLTRVVQRRANHTEASGQRATRQLAAFLDTRPSTLDAFADIAWNALFDVRLGEKYWRAVGAAGSHFTSARRWWAQRSKDEPGLRALWADETLGVSGRIDALGVLERLNKISARDADAEIDRFLSKNDDWSARESATRHLLDRGRHEHARTIARDWLTRHERSPGLEPMSARVRIAECFEAEKRWAEALEAVKPAVETWASSPMSHASVLHARLGHRDEALDLAKKVLGRYPSASSMYVGAEVRWIARDYEGAAEFLAHPPPEVRMRDKDWQELGGAFIAAFAGAPADAAKAIDALLAKKIAVESVMQMAWHAWRKNESELAFTLVARPPPPPNRAHHIGRLVNGYTMMRSWKNEQAAADWLRPQVKPEESLTLATFAMELGEEPLIWSVATEAGPPNDVEKLWALRAASARRTKSLRAKLGEVRAHYEAAPGGGYWSGIGRYLAGLTTDEAVVALARDARSSAEIAFYMGARAEGEGRYEEANDFYRSSLEADVRDCKETAQARATLARWKSGGVPLGKADEVPFPSVPEAMR